MKSKSKRGNLAKNKNFQRFKSQLGQAKKILISTHLLPDGDGLGAEVALYHYLKKTKKTCRVCNPDPLPKRYRFLDPRGEFLKDASQAEVWKEFDLWVIVDTNDPRRLGKLWEEFSHRAKKITFLDHHEEMVGVPEIIYPSHAMVVSDRESSSIGELLYCVFDQLKLARIQKDIALGLYVSIMTDTNSFRYARTTPLAHEIAGQMIQLGVNPEEVYQSVYSSKEVSHLQLLGKMLQEVKVNPSHKIAWLEMSLELRKKHQASADDTQSFLNLLLLIRDAEVVCFFREEDDGKIRVSMKSKGRIGVSKLAMDLGGGGHEFAAGLASQESMPLTVKKVIHGIEALIETVR